MTDTPRLIEHAFLLKQTSLDSVHKKNVRHGNFLKFPTDELLDFRLVGVRQDEGAAIPLCPVEHLLFLRRGGNGLPASAQRLAVRANNEKERALAYLSERVARELALDRRQSLLDSLPERERAISRCPPTNGPRPATCGRVTGSMLCMTVPRRTPGSFACRTRSEVCSPRAREAF